MNKQPDYQIIENAVRANDLILVQQLINDGFDIHYNDDFFIRISSWFGFLEMTQLLIKHGANITAKNSDPISYSAQNGHFSTVQFFIEQGVSPESGDGRALLYASKEGHYDIVKLILDSGMNADYISPTGIRKYKALSCAAGSNYVDIMQLLVQYGADIHYNDENALQTAVHYKSSKAIEFLLKNGADFNCIKKSTIIYGGEPIYEWYSQEKKNECIKNNSNKWKIFCLFMDYGFKFDLNEELLTTVIHEGDINKIDSLIQYGIDIFMNQGIALNISAANNYHHISAYLLTLGLDPNNSDIYSNLNVSESTAKFIKHIHEKIILQNYLNDDMKEKPYFNKNKI